MAQRLISIDKHQATLDDLTLPELKTKRKSTRREPKVVKLFYYDLEYYSKGPRHRGTTVRVEVQSNKECKGSSLIALGREALRVCNFREASPKDISCTRA